MNPSTGSHARPCTPRRLPLLRMTLPLALRLAAQQLPQAVLVPPT